MAKRWKLTEKGQGFGERHELNKTQLLFKTRRRVRKLDEPIEIRYNGDKFERYNLEGVMKFLRNHIEKMDVKDRIEIEGSSYDQPIWVILMVKPEILMNPLIKWGSQWVGRSPYGFAATGPPGASDCSGFTAACVRAVYGMELPHGAELQKNDDRIEIFHDGSRAEEGDFIFFNYGRLNWPQADHVEFIDKPGVRNLGSRPSTHGVAYYTMGPWDADNILCYGRLRHG